MNLGIHGFINYKLCFSGTCWLWSNGISYCRSACNSAVVVTSVTVAALVVFVPSEKRKKELKKRDAISQIDRCKNYKNSS